MKNVILFEEQVTVPELRLEFTGVLMSNTSEIRYEDHWTLGPNWYTQNRKRVLDAGGTPYLACGNDVRAAQLWASIAIPLTTSFRVAGWSDDGTVPELVEVQNLVEVSTEERDHVFRMGDAISRYEIQDALRNLKVLEFDDGQDVTMIPAQAVIRLSVIIGDV